MKRTALTHIFENKIVKTLLSVVELGLLALAVVVAVVSFFPGRNLTGGYRLFTVMSGSMEPAIHTGSLLISKPVSDPQPGTVIIYEDPRSQIPNSFVAHRVLERIETENGLQYQTKGDANNVKDSYAIDASKMIGQQLVAIPYLGYVSAFAKTPKGLLFIAILPAIIIVLLELQTIRRSIESHYEAKLQAALAKKDVENPDRSDVASHAKHLLVLLFLSITLLTNSPKLLASFTSQISAANQTFATGTWVTPGPPLFWVEENGTTNLIEWLPVTDAVSYKIYRAHESDPSVYSLIATITDGSTTYSDDRLGAETTYLYKMTTTNVFNFETDITTVSLRSGTTHQLVIDDSGYKNDLGSTLHLIK